MKGAVKKRQATTRGEQVPNRDQLLDELFPPAVLVPPPPTVTPPIEKDTHELPIRHYQPLVGQETPPQEPVPCLASDTKMEPETSPQEAIEVPPNLSLAISRPRRATRKPDCYGHNICERIESKTRYLQPGICLERQINHIAEHKRSGKTPGTTSESMPLEERNG